MGSLVIYTKKHKMLCLLICCIRLICISNAFHSRNSVGFRYSLGFSRAFFVAEYRAAIAGIKLLTSEAVLKPCPHRLHSQLNSRNCNAITHCMSHLALDFLKRKRKRSWNSIPALHKQTNTHTRTRNLVSPISMHYMFWLIYVGFSFGFDRTPGSYIDLTIYFRYVYLIYVLRFTLGFEHFQFMRLSFK